MLLVMLLLFFRSVSPPPPPPQLLLLLAMMYNVNRDAIYKNSSKIAIRFQSRVKEIAASVLFFVRDKKKTRPPRQKKSARWSKRVVQSVLCAHRQRECVCVYVQSRDNFDCLYFFVVSFYYPFFFVWGKKRFDVGKYLFIYFVGQKNIIVVVVVVQKVAAFEREKKKLDSLFFTRFIKPLPPVLLVFKKDDDDDFDDDNNALSSSV